MRSKSLPATRGDRTFEVAWKAVLVMRVLWTASFDVAWKAVLVIGLQSNLLV